MFEIRTLLILASFTLGSASFAESVEVARGKGDTSPRQPQIGIDDAGRIYIAFGRGSDVFVSRGDTVLSCRKDKTRLG